MQVIVDVDELYPHARVQTVAYWEDWHRRFDEKRMAQEVDWLTKEPPVG